MLFTAERSFLQKGSSVLGQFVTHNLHFAKFMSTAGEIVKKKIKTQQQKH